MMQFPLMFRIRQSLVKSPLADPAETLDACLEAAGALEGLGGKRVALAVGSRSIDSIALLVTALIQRLRSAGANPLVVPAMGSHGGGTAEGQAAILAGLGITPTSVGAPIDASAETVFMGTTPGGADAYTARAALDSDGIIVINRIAPHTGYSGRVQSGVVKMLAIGLGKVDGARALHEHGFSAGHLLGEVADLVILKAPPVTAIALVEDGAKQLSSIDCLRGQNIRAAEPALLARACAMWPAIPARRADLLIVEEMGKDISGIGMDPLVTGRGKDFPPGETPPFHADRLVVLRLTPASGGNATGIGHADITTQALVDDYDRAVTYRNVLTSGALYRARIPVVAPDDRQAIEMALSSLGRVRPEEARVVRISNTRALEELEVSEAVRPELEEREDVSVVSDARELSFGRGGNLIQRL